MARRDHFRNFQKKQYRSQTFRNPYFQSKSISPRTLLLVACGAALMVGLSLAAFVLSHQFALKGVEVYGTRVFSEEVFAETIRTYVRKPVFLLFDHRNRFLFDEQELKTELESVFAFESITFSVKKSILSIDLVEKQSQMIWQTADKRYVVDLKGVVIREFVNEEQGELPLFIDRNGIAVTAGVTVLTPQEIENIFVFHKRLSEQQIAFLNTQVDRLAGKWIGIETVDGYNILFDATGDIEAQASRLAVILREKVTDPKQLDYIDLRFGDHVYFQ